MAIKVYNLTALGNYNDLIVPTAAPQYPLGAVISIEDTTTKAIKKYMYVKAHTGLTAYVPYLISNSEVAGSEWITAAPATLASAVNLIGIPQVAFTSGYYGFVQIEGKATAAVVGASTSGWTVEVLNAGVTLVGVATTKLVGSIGNVITTTTGAANTAVSLWGIRAEIRATT